MLVLLRHGHSVWNRDPNDKAKEWKYAGSYDVPLSPKGIEEAIAAGDRLASLPVDVVFTSRLSRAQATVQLALSRNNCQRTPLVCNSVHESTSKVVNPQQAGLSGKFIPVYNAVQLNERSFGELEGVPSTQHDDMYTPAEVLNFRHAWDLPFPGGGESAKDVSDRVIPFFEKEILSYLKADKTVVVCAHGFSLRVLLKYLLDISDSSWPAMMKNERDLDCPLRMPTGQPITFTYNSDTGVFNDPLLVDSGDTSPSSSIFMQATPMDL